MKLRYEKVLCPQTQSFATEEVVGPVIDCVPHAHPEYELIYVASSRGLRYAGAQLGRFSEGDLSLYGPLLPHHYYSDPAESLSDRWGHARVVKFLRGFAGPSFFETPELAPVKRMLEEAAGGLDFQKSSASKALPLLDQLFKSQGAKRFALLLDLLCLLSGEPWERISAPAPDAAPCQPDERVGKALRFIHGRLAANDKPSLAEAAAQASLSTAAFSRIFKRATRKSFVAYVNEVRLERACARLLESDDTVASICYASGFNNLSNFNRQFAKRKGLTPVLFRKSFQKL
jgi:AraC-like DNA-binding protein